jgi:hypothetical protein
MKNKQILNLSFVLSIVIVLVGALFKIMHYPFSQLLLIVGLISMLVFWFVAISEIKSSTKIDGTEKFMWIFGIIFLGSVAGLVYLLSARKRIV